MSFLISQKNNIINAFIGRNIDKSPIHICQLQKFIILYSMVYITCCNYVCVCFIQVENINGMVNLGY